MSFLRALGFVTMREENWISFSFCWDPSAVCIARTTGYGWWPVLKYWPDRWASPPPTIQQAERALGAPPGPECGVSGCEACTTVEIADEIPLQVQRIGRQRHAFNIAFHLRYRCTRFSPSNCVNRFLGDCHR